MVKKSKSTPNRVNQYKSFTRSCPFARWRSTAVRSENRVWDFKNQDYLKMGWSGLFLTTARINRD
jgi:hypothetical protein